MDSVILLDTPEDAEFGEYIVQRDQAVRRNEEDLNHIMDTDDDDDQTALSINHRQSYDTMEIHNIIGTSTTTADVPMHLDVEQPWSNDSRGLQNGANTTAWTESFDYNQIKSETFNYMDDYQCVQPAIENCDDDDDADIPSDIPYNLMDIPFDTVVAVSSQTSEESHEEYELPVVAVKEEAELNISNYVEIEEVVHVSDHQEIQSGELRTEFSIKSNAPDDEGEPLSQELESIMSDHNYSNQPDEIEQSSSQPISTSQDSMETQQRTNDMSLNDLLLLIQPKASALPQDGQLELLSLVTTLLTDEKLPIEVILSNIVRSANALKSQFSTVMPSERNDNGNDDILPENESTESVNISLIPQPECAGNLPAPEDVVQSGNVEEESGITSSAQTEDESLYSEGHSEPAEYNPPVELLETIPDDVVGELNVPPPITLSQDDCLPSAGDEFVPANPLSMCLEKLNMFGQNIVIRNSILLRDMQTNCKIAKEISTDSKLCLAFINSLDSDFKDLVKQFKLVTGLSKPVTVKVEKTAEEKAEAARKLNEKSKARWLASSSSDNDTADQHNDDSRDSSVIMKRKRKRRRMLSTESSEIVKPQETDCQTDIVPPVVQTTAHADQIDEEICPSDDLAEHLVYEDSNDSKKKAIAENEVEVISKEVRNIEEINKDLGLNEDNEEVSVNTVDSQASIDLSKYHASQFSTYDSESPLPSPNPVEMNTYDEMEEDEFTVKNEYIQESQSILPEQNIGPDLLNEDSNAESVDYEPLSDDEFHGFDKDITFDDNVKLELDIGAERISGFDTVEDGNNNDDILNSVANITDDMNPEQQTIHSNDDIGE